MKQILQDLSQGATYISDAPAPKPSARSVLICTKISLISAGTERMLVDFGKASYLEKARQQPEKVRMVLEKIKTDGLLSTIKAVKSKLAQPLPLGYCNVGVVNSLGAEVTGFKVGDRVVSNGHHADVVNVSRNLCTLVPDNVDDESAAFTVLASIGLQGIRLAQPELGESFVVTGVGLIGLLTVQLLKAQGCKVLAIDFDDAKLQLAQQFGAEICNPARGEDPVISGLNFSRGNGVDGVIITASTRSSDPVSQAAKMCRKRGRIVLVGVTGLELNRADFYEKELSFQVSCSYGPGRYESAFEEQGLDYPIGFVRWTEQRNFEAVLDMLDSGQLDVKPLITHRYAFENAIDAYKVLADDKSALGILLHYNSELSGRLNKEVTLQKNIQFYPDKPVMGVIGAGNYASRVLIPAFKSVGMQLHTIASAKGLNAVIHGTKTGFGTASTDLLSIFNNKEVNTLAIITKHDSHSSLVVQALNTAKHVFVEKPLAITREQLDEIDTAYKNSVVSGKKLHLMVGFNRRFSPHIQKMKSLLKPVKEAKVFLITVNAGSIPADHWTQDINIGGGRIIGEGCHFIDLMRYLCGYPIVSVQARRMGEQLSGEITEDKAVITLGFADGSFGTIHYLANGATNFPKERIEIFTAGRILQLDNFRKLQGFNWPGFKKMNLWRQDKGQTACCKAFYDAIVQGNATPIAIEEIMEVARISIEVAEYLRTQ